MLSPQMHRVIDPRHTKISGTCAFRDEDLIDGLVQPGAAPPSCSRYDRMIVCNGVFAGGSLTIDAVKEIRTRSRLGEARFYSFIRTTAGYHVSLTKADTAVMEGLR